MTATMTRSPPGRCARRATFRASATATGRSSSTSTSTLLDGAGSPAVIGPNGCGKSTLLRALGRLLRPRAARCCSTAGRIDRLPTRHVARALGLLPQSPTAPEGLTVADLVTRGRHPHQSLVPAVVAGRRGGGGRGDGLDGGGRPRRPAGRRALRRQRQRAWIAMALAQGTDLLLLDEPTTHLDLATRRRRPRPGRPVARRPRTHRRHGAARPVAGRPVRRHRSWRCATAVVAQGPPARGGDAGAAGRRFGLQRRSCCPTRCPTGSSSSRSAPAIRAGGRRMMLIR